MNGKATIVFLLGASLASPSLWSQEKFSKALLRHPEAHREAFEELFRLEEVPVFEQETGENEFLLENGYASHEFQNANDWPPQDISIRPVAVTVIFTKYPKHRAFWLTDYHWLLARRLEALFTLDPRFNSPDVDFRILLQTDCDNEPEAMQLFHGILVKYEPVSKEVSPPPSSRERTAGPPSPDTPEANATAVRKLERFQGKIPAFNDSTVYHVLDRHPWQNATLVLDWTGSMYGYGAQGLMWHVQNETRSGIEQVVLFNDGDHKRKKKKIPGYTGGIYAEQARPVTKPLKLINKVKNRGEGGDGPENDIEALYTAILTYPEAGEVVLVADNNSCIRDYALLDCLAKPVRIILCSTERGINPQYLNLAWKTGGSIHTDSLDLWNIRELVASDSLVINGVRYTVTLNNLITPVSREDNPYRYCDRYYQLSSRQRRKVIRQQKRRDPKCYFKE